jgi:leucyl aminopeptidase (aminopeptidase T)
MRKIKLSQLTLAFLATLGLTFSYPSAQPTLAQNSPTTTEAVEEDSASENFQDAQQSLKEAGQETIQGVEAASEAASQQAQEAAQDAQQAAQEAQKAAARAVESVQEQFNWGWLGLIGLFGLFGLAGGKRDKRRVDVNEHYTQPPTAPSRDYR